MAFGGNVELVSIEAFAEDTIAALDANPETLGCINDSSCASGYGCWAGCLSWNFHLLPEPIQGAGARTAARKYCKPCRERLCVPRSRARVIPFDQRTNFKNDRNVVWTTHKSGYKYHTLNNRKPSSQPTPPSPIVIWQYEYAIPSDPCLQPVPDEYCDGDGFLVLKFNSNLDTFVALGAVPDCGGSRGRSDNEEQSGKAVSVQARRGQRQRAAPSSDGSLRGTPYDEAMEMHAGGVEEEGVGALLVQKAREMRPIVLKAVRRLKGGRKSWALVALFEKTVLGALDFLLEHAAEIKTALPGTGEAEGGDGAPDGNAMWSSGDEADAGGQLRSLACEPEEMTTRSLCAEVEDEDEDEESCETSVIAVAFEMLPIVEKELLRLTDEGKVDADEAKPVVALWQVLSAVRPSHEQADAGGQLRSLACEPEEMTTRSLCAQIEDEEEEEECTTPLEIARKAIADGTSGWPREYLALHQYVVSLLAKEGATGQDPEEGERVKRQRLS